MKASHALSLFATCTRMGFKHIVADKITMFGSYLVYAALMLLYAGVIRLIPDADLAPYGYTHNQMIWYIGTAEFIVFCGTEWWFKELQNDVTSEQIHLSLLRPVSSAFLRVSIWFGEAIARTLFLIPFYLLIMTVLADGYMPSLTEFAGVFSSIPLAAMMMACGAYMVGGSCLWFVQAEPAYWIWQKCIFLLGAMMWPMAFYPDWAQAFMWMTPFPGILANGSNWVLDLGGWVHVLGFVHQALWAIAFLFLLRRFDRKVLRYIQESGA